MNTDQLLTYRNPRIDHPGTTANAVDGQVSVDPSKVVWLTTMLVGGVIGSALTASPGAIALFVTFSVTTLCFGHSLGMHRLFIHRSYECPKWLEYFMVHLGTLIGLAGPNSTLRTHDLRDWAQRQHQCHDYFAHARPWIVDAWWQMFCSIKLKDPPEFIVEPNIATDRVYTGMEKTWMLQQLPWAVLFFLIGGWGWVFWGICTRVCVSVLGHWLVGYFAHNEGPRDWHVKGAAVQGHNIPFTSLLTMGECWHNNHHAFPESARLGLESSQWDPGWWMLCLMERCGLVKNLVVPTTTSTRDELEDIRESGGKSPLLGLNNRGVLSHE